MTTDDPERDRAIPEHTERDSPRFTAPDVRRPWILRAAIIITILAIVTIVATVAYFGVGGHADATSDPADTPAEIEETGAP